MPKSIPVICAVLFSIYVQGQSHKDTCCTPVKTLITADSAVRYPIRLLPANYYTNHLPFFCDKEWKLEKAIKIPVKIRLGSVDYVNHLEGKH